MSRQDHRNSAESRYNASAHDLTVSEPVVSWKSDKNVNDHRIMPETISFTGVFPPNWWIESRANLVHHCDIY